MVCFFFWGGVSHMCGWRGGRGEDWGMGDLVHTMTNRCVFGGGGRSTGSQQRMHAP